MPASKARREARAASTEAKAATTAAKAATPTAKKQLPPPAAASSAWENVDEVVTNKPDEPTVNEADTKGHASFKERISCTVFVGQLPYSATAADVRRHFKSNGVAGGVQVRLRTERDGSSRGTAFIEFDSESDVHTALRLHHSVMNGRRINVERTVGGGGSVEKRKQRLSDLRSRQGHQMQQTVETLIRTVLPAEAEASAHGASASWAADGGDGGEDDGHVPVTQADVDERVREFLTTVPTPLAEEALREAKALHMGGIRNRPAYLMGVLKRKVAESDRLRQQPHLQGQQQRGATKRGRAPEAQLRPPAPTEAAPSEEPKAKKSRKAKAADDEEAQPKPKKLKKAAEAEAQKAPPPSVEAEAEAEQGAVRKPKKAKVAKKVKD